MSGVTTRKGKGAAAGRLHLGAPELTVDDCRRFELLFGRVVRQLVGGESVAFLVEEPAPLLAGTSRPAAEDLPQAWETGVLLVRRRGAPVGDPEHRRVFLPLLQGDEVVAVAIVEGVGEAVLRQSEGWLQQVSRELSRQCLEVKKWAVEPLTGLPGSAAFLQELALLAAEEGRLHTGAWLTVAFLEVAGAGGVVDRARGATGRLRELLGEEAPLYHFGGGLFAMIWHRTDLRAGFALGSAVLDWMRRDGAGAVSLGMESCRLTGEEDPESLARRLVEHGLAALETARRRGPTGLCNYAAEDAAGRLAGPPPTVAHRLARHWRGRERFAVFVITGRPAGSPLSRRLLSLVGEVPCYPTEDRTEAWGVLVDGDQEQVADLARRLARGATEGAGAFLLGAALYPCPGFRKGQVAVNARKAAVHAAFYGDNGWAVFDDKSCNISGDIYYEDGNLAAAVREYRAGLRLNPESVNLRNSLGVCYAQMGADHRAIPFFRQALDRAPRDFMALFNLGLAYRQIGKTTKAMAVFEEAHRVNPEEAEVLFHLGELAVTMERYREAVDWLSAWLERAATATGGATRRRSIQVGRAHAGLARAWLAQGDGKRAVAALERAVAANPRDGWALGVLADLYRERGEDPALVLALAQQAVAVDDAEPGHWYRLAALHGAAGALEEARAAARACLERDPGHDPPRGAAGALEEARAAARACLERDPGHDQAAELLRNLGRCPTQHKEKA